jgi:hypothetical protein
VIDANLSAEPLAYNDPAYSMPSDEHSSIPPFVGISATDFFMEAIDIDMNFDWVSNGFRTMLMLYACTYIAQDLFDTEFQMIPPVLEDFGPMTFQ